MIALDTSVLVRHLLGRPAEQALRARELIGRAERVGVSTLVLLEAGHVLRTDYRVSRSDTVEALLEFITNERVEVLGLQKVATVHALARAREHPSAPFADALIAAAAESAGAESIASFDRRMRRHGLPVVEP